MPLVVRFSEPPSAQPQYGVVEDGTVAVIAPHPFTEHRRTGRTVPLADVRLLAPTIPSKIDATTSTTRRSWEETSPTSPSSFSSRPPP